eukprot:2097540-Amphidinium_carterae.1
MSYPSNSSSSAALFGVVIAVVAVGCGAHCPPHGILQGQTSNCHKHMVQVLMYTVAENLYSSAK